MLRSVCCFSIWIIVARMLLAIFTWSDFCMIVKWLLSSIQFIHWFITCLDLYVFFNLNYCSMYVICHFTRSHYFVCLWDNHYFISGLLIDSFLALICILFLFIWIIGAGIILAIWQEVITLDNCELIIILYPVYRSIA